MDLSTFYSMAEDTVKAVTDEKGYSYVWSVVITGLTVVFLGLIILILFVWVMGKIFSAIEKSKTKKKDAVKVQPAVQKPAAAKPKAEPKAAAPSEDSDEIIAVISAAVAAMGQAEGKKYKVKQIKAAGGRASRSAWSMAGLQNDTMPF